jgi:hypothetical protein
MWSKDVNLLGLRLIVNLCIYICAILISVYQNFEVISERKIKNNIENGLVQQCYTHMYQNIQIIWLWDIWLSGTLCKDFLVFLAQDICSYHGFFKGLSCCCFHSSTHTECYQGSAFPINQVSLRSNDYLHHWYDRQIFNLTLSILESTFLFLHGHLLLPAPLLCSICKTTVWIVHVYTH